MSSRVHIYHLSYLSFPFLKAETGSAPPPRGTHRLLGGVVELCSCGALGARGSYN